MWRHELSGPGDSGAGTVSQWRWRSEVRLAEPDQLQPEEPVPSAQAWAALGSESDLELLAQQEILEKEVVAASEGSGKRGEEEPKEFRASQQDR